MNRRGNLEPPTNLHSRPKPIVVAFDSWEKTQEIRMFSPGNLQSQNRPFGPSVMAGGRMGTRNLAGELFLPGAHLEALL